MELPLLRPFFLLFILLTPSSSLSLILISLSNTHMNRQDWTLEHMCLLYHPLLNSQPSVSTDTIVYDWLVLFTGTSNVLLCGAPQRGSAIRQTKCIALRFFVNQSVLHNVMKVWASKQKIIYITCLKLNKNK